MDQPCGSLMSRNKIFFIPSFTFPLLSDVKTTATINLIKGKVNFVKNTDMFIETSFSNPAILFIQCFSEYCIQLVWHDFVSALDQILWRICISFWLFDFCLNYNFFLLISIIPQSKIVEHIGPHRGYGLNLECQTCFICLWKGIDTGIMNWLSTES